MTDEPPFKVVRSNRRDELLGTGCSRHWVANPGPQRQQQRRDRCGFRNFCARAARRPLRQRRPPFHRPACPIDPPGDASRDPCYICGTSISRNRRADELWSQPDGRVASSRRLCSSRAPSQQTCRSCRRASSSWSSRPGRPNARPHSTADAARPRRRGDRMRRRPVNKSGTTYRAHDYSEG